jgi:hypothetical protein
MSATSGYMRCQQSRDLPLVVSFVLYSPAVPYSTGILDCDVGKGCLAQRLRLCVSRLVRHFKLKKILCLKAVHWKHSESSTQLARLGKLSHLLFCKEQSPLHRCKGLCSLHVSSLPVPGPDHGDM